MLKRLLHLLLDRHSDHQDYHPFDEDLYDRGKGWPKQMRLF